MCFLQRSWVVLVLLVGTVLGEALPRAGEYSSAFPASSQPPVTSVASQSLQGQGPSSLPVTSTFPDL